MCWTCSLPRVLFRCHPLSDLKVFRSCLGPGSDVQVYHYFPISHRLSLWCVLESEFLIKGKCVFVHPWSIYSVSYVGDVSDEQISPFFSPFVFGTGDIIFVTEDYFENWESNVLTGFGPTIFWSKRSRFANWTNTPSLLLMAHIFCVLSEERAILLYRFSPAFLEQVSTFTTSMRYQRIACLKCIWTDHHLLKR